MIAARPLRIALVQTQAENAGAQEISHLLAKGLEARGHAVRQIFFFRRTASFDNVPNAVFCCRERPSGPLAFWNFLPPVQLDQFLNLYQRVAGKTLRISKTFGIEGRQLLKGDDDYDDLKNLVSLDGDKSFEEQLQIEFEQLKIADPGLAVCRT